MAFKPFEEENEQNAQQNAFQPAQAQGQPAPISQPAPNQMAQPVSQVAPQPKFGPSAQQPQQPNQSPQRPAPTPKPVTAFSRLQGYLGSNQPQAQGLAGDINLGVGQQATVGRQALASAGQQFQDMVAKAGLTRNQTRSGALIAKAAALKAGQTLSAEELSELTNIAKTSGAFEGLAPKDLNAIADYAKTLTSFDNAKNIATLSGSEAGRESLFGEVYGQDRNYSGGQSLLDSILTGSTKPAAKSLEGMRKEYVEGDVLGKENLAAVDAAKANRQAEADEIAAAKGDVTSGIGMKQGEGALGGIEQLIRDRIAETNRKKDSVNALIDSAYRDGNIGRFGWSKSQQELIKEMGLSDGQVRQIRATGGLNSEIFLKLKEMNEQTGTSGDELAKLKALYNIADSFGRDSSKIQALERDDLGQLINQKAGLDQEKMGAAQKVNNQQAEQDKRTKISNVLSSTIDNYRFGGKVPVGDVAIDIYDRLRTGNLREDIDNPEADKAIGAMERAAREVAQNFYDRGLVNSPDEYMRRYQVSDSDIFGGAGLGNTMKKNGKGYDGTMAAIIAESPIYVRNGQGPFGISKPRTIEELKRLDPKLYERVYSSALRMARIKKFADDYGFFNKFRHQQ